MRWIFRHLNGVVYNNHLRYGHRSLLDQMPSESAGALTMRGNRDGTKCVGPGSFEDQDSAFRFETEAFDAFLNMASRNGV